MPGLIIVSYFYPLLLASLLQNTSTIYPPLGNSYFTLEKISSRKWSSLTSIQLIAIVDS